MTNGFIKKSKAERDLEFAQIVKHGDREVAFRWMREETLRVAEETLQEDIPRILTHYNGPAKDIEDIGWFISELARQLRQAPYPLSRVPRIPFPLVPN